MTPPGSNGSPDAASSHTCWPVWLTDRRVFEELGSTQDEARRLVAAGECEFPLLVLANRQTAGRGRGDNRWSAGEGALTFTVGIVPESLGVSIDRTATLSIATALGICEGLQAYADRTPFQIKWPNDVYAGGRKMCGILAQSVPRAGGGTAALIGIGVNVANVPPADAIRGPAKATNLASIADRALPPTSDILCGLLESLRREWLVLGRGEADQVERWNARNLLYGRSCTVERGAESRRLLEEGVAGPIDATGALTVTTSNESGATETKKLLSGSIVAWDDAGEELS